MKHEIVLCITLAVIVFLSFLSVCNVEPATGCYGPQITAIIGETQVNINENVTVTGRVYPIETNVTVRVPFIRPNFSWIDCYVIADNKTGEFLYLKNLT